MKLSATHAKAFVVCSFGMMGLSLWAGAAARNVAVPPTSAAVAGQALGLDEGSLTSAEIQNLYDSHTAGINQIHLYVKGVAIPYFLFSAFVFGVLALHAGWLFSFATGVSIAMLTWTFLLDRNTDFSQVYVAWLAVSVVFGLIIGMALRANFHDEAKELQTSSADRLRVTER